MKKIWYTLLLCWVSAKCLLHKHTSRHLFHEDLDVPILRNGAQVLNNVPVLQVLVKGDLFMKGLRVSDPQREKDFFFLIYANLLSLLNMHILSKCIFHTKQKVNWLSKNESYKNYHTQPHTHLPAVSFRDLFDSDSDLVAEVSPSIHHSIGAAP